MKKIIKLMLLIAIILMTENVEALSIGRVTHESGATLRKGPGANTEKLGTLYYNDTAVINSYMKVTSSSGCPSGWYSVNYNGNEGYVCSNYISKSTYTIRTNYTNGVNTRNGVGTNYHIYKKIENNKLLTLSNVNKFKGKGCSSNWYSININTYKNKYICSNYIKNYNSKSNVIITNEDGVILKNSSFENTDISLEYNQGLTLYDSVLYTGKTYWQRYYKIYYQNKIYYIEQKDVLNTNVNGTVNNYNGVNIRTGAGTSYNVEKKLPYNTHVSLVSTDKHKGTGCKAGWYKLKLNEENYYICSTYVSLTNKTMKVNRAAVNIRAGAGSNYNLVKSISKGTTILLQNETKYKGTGCNSGWYKIELDGKKRYICSSYTKIYNEEKDKEYKVKIETENAEIDKSEKTVKKNSEVTFTIIPNKGYKMKSVDCTNDQIATIENNVLKISNITANTICNVIYEPIKYEIKYNANGANGTMPNSLHTYDIESTLTESTFTKEGYTFLGWNTDKNATKVIYTDKENINNLSSTDKEIINLYAIWEKVYNVGDIIELKDGSKYYYLNKDENDNINLLSMYFLNENGEFVKNSTNAYTSKFSESTNNNYEESIIKKFLDETFAPKLKSNLIKQEISEEVLNELKIGLPKAEIISKAGGITNWTSQASDQFLMTDLNKYFLTNVGLTYWTSTPKGENYVWIVNKYYKIWYASPKFIENDISLGIRPMITIQKENLKQIANENEITTIDVVSSDYLIYDVNKNEIIKQKIDQTDELWYPASVTKLTTLIVAIEEMEKQNINLTDKVTITEEMLDLPSGESKAGFELNDVVTYEDLIYGITNKSGGDACMALAISLKGSETEFVKLMNEYAKKHNMTDTNYANTRGLINVNNHYSSLKDIALGFKAAMENETFRTVMKPKAYQTTTGLNFAIPEFSDFKYLIGSKNGHAVYSDDIRSGYNQANYYQKDDKEYIVVTSSDKYDKTKENRTLDNYFIYKWLFKEN